MVIRSVAGLKDAGTSTASGTILAPTDPLSSRSTPGLRYAPYTSWPWSSRWSKSPYPSA